MTVVCIPNCIVLSATSRMIAVYRELKKLDVHVIIATHGGPYTFVLDEHHIPNEVIEPSYSQAFCDRYMQSIYDGGRTQNYTYNELLSHVNGEIKYYKRKGARIILSGFTLSTRLSTTATGIPLVVTHLGSWTPITFEKYGIAAHQYFKNSFTRLLPEKWTNAFGSWLFPRLKSYLKVFNAVSSNIGIAPCRSLFDLLLGDHTLITDVPQILGISEEEVAGWKPVNQHMYRPHSKITYTGPIYARLFGEIPMEVLQFLDTDKPKIYVAMNSGHESHLQIVYNTLAHMDVVAVLVSTVHVNSTLNHARNILVKPFLPSHKVMPHCDLAIIHGGQGTIQTAIASGIPLIGFPLQPEQNFNLKRIEAHHAGLCMALYDLRKGKLKKAITEILTDPGFQSAARELKSWQDQRHGAQLTALYIQ